MLIRNFPVAQALHMRSCQDLDTEQLRDILVQEDDFLGQGLLRVKEAYNSSVSSFFLSSNLWNQVTKPHIIFIVISVFEVYCPVSFLRSACAVNRVNVKCNKSVQGRFGTSVKGEKNELWSARNSGVRHL